MKNYDFSLKEKQVLKRIATGMMNPEIADELFISIVTVKSHLNSIYNKLAWHDIHFKYSALAKRLKLMLWCQDYFRQTRPELDIENIPLDEFF